MERTAGKKIEKLIESFGIHLSLVGGCFVVSFFSQTLCQRILTPTRTGHFLLTSVDPEFYAMLCQRIALSARMSPSCEMEM